MTLRQAISPILACAAFTSAFMWWRAEHKHTEVLARLAAVQTGRPNPEQAAAPAAQPGAPLVAEPGARIIRVPAGTNPAEYVRAADNKLIEDLTDTVAQLRRELAIASENAEKAIQRATAAAEEQVKLSNQLEELKDRIQVARDNSAAVQAELKVKSDRLASLESGQKPMAERLARAEAAAGRTLAAGRELEDLHRRRDLQIANLQRRYREVTDIYRAFALDIQNREHAAAANQAGDLSRIQTAIQQAEDDLRQLQTLNARITQLQRVP